MILEPTGARYTYAQCYVVRERFASSGKEFFVRCYEQQKQSNRQGGRERLEILRTLLGWFY
jgi:hypothetical protein